MRGIRIIIPMGSQIPARYIRGGIGFGRNSTIPPGRYLVEDEHDGSIELAHADWEDDENPESPVTYHSGKHIYRVRRVDLVITIDLLTAMPAKVEA